MVKKQATRPLSESHLIVTSLLKSVYSSIQSSGEDSKHWHHIIWGKCWSKAALAILTRSNIFQLAVLTPIQFVKSALSSRRYESSWTLDWASPTGILSILSLIHSTAENKRRPVPGEGLQVENPSSWMAFRDRLWGRI